VLDRLHAQGTRVHASPACGAWSWPAAAGALQGHCERERARRYWHHRSVPE
jgi:competence protein ComEC